jgi:hypothetical protein
MMTMAMMTMAMMTMSHRASSQYHRRSEPLSRQMTTTVSAVARRRCDRA